MNYFALVGLLVVVGLAGWFMTRSTTPVVTEGEDSQPSMTEAVDDARAAAEQLVGSAAMVEVYPGISVPERATSLDLSGRGLEGSLKAEVRLLQSLTTLNLSDNDFTGLPAEVGQLQALRVLNLANNPLTGIPHELGNLKSLEVLDLRGTNYATADLEVITERLPSTVQILVD